MGNEARKAFTRFKERVKDPRRYLAEAEDQVRKSPDDPSAYHERHIAWDLLGRKDLALKDLDTAVALRPSWGLHEDRAVILRQLGRYREALQALNRAEAMNPEDWAGGFGLLFRADTHARLGDEAAALADCARLPDDHWTPGFFGAPGGDKQQVITEIKRRAAIARQRAG